VLVLDGGAQSIARAAEIIRAGGIAAFPTETVYGLGADAFNTRALARVFEAKGRPRFDPLIIHIACEAALERIADLDALRNDRRALVKTLCKSLWPGPLTMVLPKKSVVPDLATSGLPTAAVRFPSHPLAQQLIAQSTGAVAAPSANKFGRLSPTAARHVIEDLGEKIDCVIDGGPCEVGVESTVLDLCSRKIRILRPGGTSAEELRAVLGDRLSDEHYSPAEKDGARENQEDSDAQSSPGMLKSHYAPSVPLVLYTSDTMDKAGKAVFAGYTGRVITDAFLFFSSASRNNFFAQSGLDKKTPGVNARFLVLSEHGDTIEAAANLFACLHRLEALAPRRIYAELLPEHGLGEAVNDRLRRGAIRP
jgi:L-threonylcarbamoyladenylate synthase